MKLNAKKINKCVSLREITDNYKSIILQSAAVSEGFKFVVMPYKHNIIIVVNANLPEIKYIDELKSELLNL